MDKESSTDMLKFDIRCVPMNHKFVVEKKLFGNIPLPFLVHLFTIYQISSDKWRWEEMLNDVNINKEFFKDPDGCIIIYNRESWRESVIYALSALKNPQEKPNDLAKAIMFFRDEYFANK